MFAHISNYLTKVVGGSAPPTIVGGEISRPFNPRPHTLFTKNEAGDVTRKIVVEVKPVSSAGRVAIPLAALTRAEKFARWDMVEKEDAFVIAVEIPGVTNHDGNLAFLNGQKRGLLVVEGTMPKTEFTPPADFVIPTDLTPASPLFTPHKANIKSPGSTASGYIVASPGSSTPISEIEMIETVGSATAVFCKCTASGAGHIEGKGVDKVTIDTPSGSGAEEEKDPRKQYCSRSKNFPMLGGAEELPWQPKFKLDTPERVGMAGQIRFAKGDNNAGKDGGTFAHHGCDAAAGIDEREKLSGTFGHGPAVPDGKTQKHDEDEEKCCTCGLPRAKDKKQGTSDKLATYETNKKFSYWHVANRGVGDFRFEFHLPVEHFDLSTVEHTLCHGMLHVTVPKMKEPDGTFKEFNVLVSRFGVFDTSN